jgi:hypothetical protein
VLDFFCEEEPMPETLSIRAVVYQDRGWWVAQCLEYDLGTSAKSRDALPRKLVSVLRVQIAADLECGKQPLQDLPKAPKRFWDMHANGTPIEVVKLTETGLDKLASAERRSSPIRAQIALAAA